MNFFKLTQLIKIKKGKQLNKELLYKNNKIDINYMIMFNL